MIFGRKKRQDNPDEAKVEEEPRTNAVEENPEPEKSENQLAMEKAEAQWLAWDEEFEREEGPFDIEEVDLDADDVQRLDLGSLVVTPFEGMNMQITMNKQQVPQALVVSDGRSALEVAVFGAPLKSAYVPEVRREILTAASQTKGTRITVRNGPFGTEISRMFPVQTQEGQQGMQVTRTWLAEGPSWVLRGVLFGRAAVEPDNEDATLALTEFFANLVVRRGDKPVAPGAVIPFTLPEGAQPAPSDESGPADRS